MKRGQVTYFIIIGLIILMLTLSSDINADKKECDRLTDLAEKGIKNNFDGYTKEITKAVVETPIRLRSNIISGYPKPNDIIKRNTMVESVTKGINEGDLLHGTSLEGFRGILNDEFLKPTKAFEGKEEVWTSKVFKDKSSAVDYSIDYAIGRSKKGRMGLILRIKNHKAKYNAFATPVMLKDTRGIPLKDIEVWDPVTNKWVPAEKYK